LQANPGMDFPSGPLQANPEMDFPPIAGESRNGFPSHCRRIQKWTSLPLQANPEMDFPPIAGESRNGLSSQDRSKRCSVRVDVARGGASQPAASRPAPLIPSSTPTPTWRWQTASSQDVCGKVPVRNEFARQNSWSRPADSNCNGAVGLAMFLPPRPEAPLA
jgi:hypothetical protein